MAKVKSMLSVFFLLFFMFSLFSIVYSTDSSACGQSNNDNGQRSNAGENSCGWGQAGGGEFSPRNNGTDQSSRSQKLLTQAQAYDIITKYLTRLNSGLKASKGKDLGRFYKFEILSNNKRVEQLVVDKTTGWIRSIN